jgi:hypothetical protein
VDSCTRSPRGARMISWNWLVRFCLVLCWACTISRYVTQTYVILTTLCQFKRSCSFQSDDLQWWQDKDLESRGLLSYSRIRRRPEKDDVTVESDKPIMWTRFDRQPPEYDSTALPLHLLDRPVMLPFVRPITVVYGMKCLRPLKHCDREFESHSRHGCLSAFILFLQLSCVWSPVQEILRIVYKIQSSKCWWETVHRV